jgi:hypothetical protein
MCLTAQKSNMDIKLIFKTSIVSQKNIDPLGSKAW